MSQHGTYLFPIQKFLDKQWGRVTENRIKANWASILPVRSVWSNSQFWIALSRKLPSFSFTVIILTAEQTSLSARVCLPGRFCKRYRGQISRFYCQTLPASPEQRPRPIVLRWISRSLLKVSQKVLHEEPEIYNIIYIALEIEKIVILRFLCTISLQ